MRHSTHTATGRAGRRPAAPPTRRAAPRTLRRMPAPLATLVADHENFHKLLCVFEEELAQFHDAGRPDYGIMRDVMHYVTHYPDRAHHPLEDLIFRRLVRAYPAARRAVEAMEREHAWLTAAGSELLLLLDEILSDAMLSRESVETLARSYVQRLREHMVTEEQTLFPLAGRRLSAQDWAAIAAGARQLGDPLFGDVIAEQEYRAIRERLAV